MSVFSFLFGSADDANDDDEFAYTGSASEQDEAYDSQISDETAADLIDESYAYELVEQNCAGYNETIYYAFDHESGVGAMELYPAHNDGTVAVIGVSANVDNARWAAVASDDQILQSLLDAEEDY